MNNLLRFMILSAVFLLAIVSILATDDDNGNSNTFNAETTKIDCLISKIKITSTVSGVNSPSGDTVTGEITIKCDEDLVDGVTITSSTLWFASVGPSVSGVISVSSAANFSDDDVGTKTINITAKGIDASGNDAETVIPISVTIS